MTAKLQVVSHDDSGLPAHARRLATHPDLVADHLEDATIVVDPTPLRRCIGSATFGIAAHDAPIAEFPVQPSRKDGLGLMCRPHWTEYTRGLRQAQRARQAAATAPTAPAETSGAPTTPPKAKKAATRARGGRGAKDAAAIEEARAIVASTDALSGSAYLEAVASDRVQDALRLLSTQADGPAIHDAMRTRMDEETER